MIDPPTVIVGIPIPSTSRIFLAILTVHVVAGLACVVSGLIAMFAEKRAGRHVAAGTFYYWSLVCVGVSMTALSVMRWPEDAHLLILGIASYAAATIGRAARRGVWRRWVEWHAIGMGLSYILLLTAFYVDNGPNLPVWRRLPTMAFWFGPSAVGLPILLYVLVRHPLAKASRLRRFSGSAAR
jgi:hypothetical protein